MIIVLGATGTIGQHLVRILEKQGEDFVIVARDKQKASAQFPKAKIRYGDLSKATSLKTAFQGGNALFLVSPHGPDMVSQQCAAILRASKLGIKRIVKISGSNASVAEDSVYAIGREHWEIEQTLKEHADEFVILRCNFFMQNLLEEVAAMVRSQRKILMPFSKNLTFCFLDAQDIAQCAVNCFNEPQHAQKTYHLTGRKSSFSELASILSQQLGSQIRYRSIPLFLAKLALRLKGKPRWLVEHQIEMSQFFRAGGASIESSDIGLILKNPPALLENFLSRHLAYFKTTN